MIKLIVGHLDNLVGHSLDKIRNKNHFERDKIRLLYKEKAVEYTKNRLGGTLG